MKIEEIQTSETQVEQQQETDETETEVKQQETESETEDAKLLSKIPFLNEGHLFAISFAQDKDFSVHIFDHNRIIIYCNKAAELLYGHSYAESMGANATTLLMDAQHYAIGDDATAKTASGERCHGRFPVVNKTLHHFLVVATNMPLVEDGIYHGAISISRDARHYQGDLFVTVRPPPRPFANLTQIIPDLMAALRNKFWFRPGLIGNTVDQDQETTSDIGSSSSSASVSSVGPTINSATHYNDVDIDLDFWDLEIPFQQLNIIRLLGEGAFSAVYYGTCWQSTEVAIKMINTHENFERMQLAFKKEVSIMKKLRHPNVLPLLGVVTSSGRLWIVTEFHSGGTLSWLLRNKISDLDWRRRVQIALDIAQGLNYLHHCVPPIVHGDVKSSNILIDKKWSAKVADMNLASPVSEMDHFNRGTLEWMAPEVHRNEACDKKSDVYSYGVVLWELITGKEPWKNFRSEQVQLNVECGVHLQIPRDMAPRWKFIIQRCWRLNRHERPSFDELISTLKNIQKQARG